jgi:flagellar hook-associated protein FlgK
MEVLAERLECLEASWKDLQEKRAAEKALLKSVNDVAPSKLEELNQQISVALVATRASYEHLCTDRDSLVKLVQAYFV